MMSLYNHEIKYEAPIHSHRHKDHPRYIITSHDTSNDNHHHNLHVIEIITTMFSKLYISAKIIANF